MIFYRALVVFFRDFLLEISNSIPNLADLVPQNGRNYPVEIDWVYALGNVRVLIRSMQHRVVPECCATSQAILSYIHRNCIAGIAAFGCV